MKQSKSRITRENTAILYERLSRDDNLEGDSYSIQNQKKLLAKVAKEKGYTHLLHFYDDGISGVTMERPGFQAMLAEIEQGKASAVFVKDLSRLGRNYIEVGKLMEDFFPEHDIRFVSVSDNIDTDEGENELAPIKNLFNEWYSRDISKKRRISNKIKGNAGEPMGQPPYGYQKDPDDPKRWIIDEEAAAVVRRIYRMSLDGCGVEQIADALSKDGILTPRFYWQQKGIHRPGKAPKYDPCHWNSSTITRILTLQEYCGDVLNFKTYSKSYKNKRGWRMTVRTGPSSWMCMSQSSRDPRGRRFKRSEEKSASAGPMRVRKICFPACWSAPTAEAICISTSTREIQKSPTSTAPTTRATVEPAPQPTTSGLTFWNRSFWRKSGA